MAEQGDNELFAFRSQRNLFSRLKLELSDLKGRLARPVDSTTAPSHDPQEEHLPSRLLGAVREFAKDLKARPAETLAGSFLPDPAHPLRQQESLKIVAASFAAHAALVALLVYSGALSPLFREEGARPGRDYEVTMLAAETLPPAPWMETQPAGLDPLAPDASFVQSPAMQTPPPVQMQPPPARLGRMNRAAPAPSVISNAADVPVEDDATQAGGAAASATPGATPGESSKESNARKETASNNAAAQPSPSKTTPAAGSEGSVEPTPGEILLREVLSKAYADYQKAEVAQAPANFTSEAEFKIDADGRLSDIKIITPSGSQIADEGLLASLAALGELRLFESLAKLSTRNTVRVELNDTSARLTVSCLAGSKELAEAMTPVLTVVSRNILNSLGEELLATEAGIGLSVTSEGNRVDSAFSLTRQQASEIMRARFGQTTPPAQQER